MSTLLNQPTNKRSKSIHDAATSNPLSRLLSQSSTVNNLIHRISAKDDPGEVERELNLLTTRLDAFKDSNHDVEGTESESERYWRDTLDAEGTSIWNKSTAIRIAVSNSQSDSQKWSKCIAKMRKAAYDLVSLGAIVPLTIEARVNLLSLATKASAAFASLGDTLAADHLTTSGATHAAALTNDSESNTKPSGDVPKALLAHYSARIEASSKAENFTLAKWVMERAKVQARYLGPREIEQLAMVAYHVGFNLIDPSSAANSNGGKSAKEKIDQRRGETAAASIEWFLWATELIEGGELQSSKELQISILQSLAQAFLDCHPLQSGWKKAEEVIRELIKLSPTTAIYRRLIRLVIARGGGEGEIIDLFKSCAEMMDWTENEGMLIMVEMHHLPAERRGTKFSIIDALTQTTLDRMKNGDTVPTESNELGVGPTIFIAQLVMAAVFLVDSHDLQRVKSLFDRVVQGGCSLAASPAFVCSTCCWRLGDQSHKENLYERAAEWYLLGAHPILKSLEQTTWEKSRRKAALCFSEVKQYDRAEEIIHQGSGVDSAKNHFVRFYNAALQRDEVRAIAAIRSVVSVPDFELKMLLWMAKTAHESSMKRVLNQVLVSLLEVCEKGSAKGIDLLVLVRCLIRLGVSSLDTSGADQREIVISILSHFEASLGIIQSISPTNRSTISKDLAWLSKTAYNLCVRYNDDWSLEIVCRAYSITAHLMELSATSSGSIDNEPLSRMFLCRFVSLSSRSQAARENDDDGNQVTTFKTILPDINSLRVDIRNARSRKQHVDRAEEIEMALYALEVEALAGTREWSEVGRLVDSFALLDPPVSVKTIKMIAEKVASSKDCPASLVCSILQRALETLLKRRDLDSSSLAAWLRTVIVFVVDKGAAEDALPYVAHALALLRSQTHQYPAEELSWLISFTWDQGLQRFSASDPVRARTWCEVALEAVKFSDPALESRLVGYYADINSRQGTVD